MEIYKAHASLNEIKTFFFSVMQSTCTLIAGMSHKKETSTSYVYIHIYLFII